MYLLRLGLRLAPGYRRSLLPVVAIMVASCVAVLTLLGLAAARLVAAEQIERLIAREPILGEGSGPVIVHRVDRYEVGVVERYVAAAGESSSLIPPGLSRLPRPGEVFLSPALIDLVEEGGLPGLAFPNRHTAVVGPEGLQAPHEMVAWVGADPQDLDAPPSIGFGNRGAVPELLGGGYWWFYALTVIPFVIIPIGFLIAAAARTATRLRHVQIMALRALGLTPWQVATALTIGLALAAVGGGVAGALLVEPLIRLVSSLRPFGVDFFVEDAAPSLLTLVTAVALVAAMATAIALLGAARASKYPLPPRPTLQAQIHSRVGLVVLAVAGGLIGLLLTPIRLPQLTEILVLYAAVTLGVIGMALGVTPMVQWLASLAAPHTSGATGLLVARRLQARPGTATRLASALAVGVFVVALLQPASELLGGSKAWEESVLAVQEAKGRSLVLVTEVPPDVSLTTLQGEPGIQAVVPIADGFDPETGENLGRSLLIAPCSLVNRLALIEGLTCPPGPWLLQPPESDVAVSTLTVKDAISQQPIAISVTGVAVDLGLPPEENLDGLVVIDPDEATDLAPSGFESRTYLAVLDPGNAARDRLRAGVARLAPGASLLDSLESSVGGSRRLAPLLGYLEAMIGLGLALVGLAVAIVGADSISDDRHHLSALRRAGAPLRNLRTVQAAAVAIPGAVAAVLAAVFGMAVALVLQARRELAADLGSIVLLAASSSAAWIVWAWASTSRLGQRLSDLSRRG